MVFVVTGLLISEYGLGVFSDNQHLDMLYLLTEITLAFILFTDAASVETETLRKFKTIPLRLICIGLPLSIILGTLVAIGLFEELPLWEAAILATLLTPTDAALSNAIIHNKFIPDIVRRNIAIESGLNDGICLPFLLIFLCLARLDAHEDMTSYWIQFTVLQLTVGPLVGVVIAYLGGRLIRYSTHRKLLADSYQNLVLIALTLIIFGLAELLDGNVFIATYVGGFVVSRYCVCKNLRSFIESEGRILSLFTFLIFGALLIPAISSDINAKIILYAVLSLTLIRMLPVAISLLGTNTNRETVLALGWFGPRGIASIVFGLFIMQSPNIIQKDLIVTATMLGILLSVFFHGISSHIYAVRCIKKTRD